jgi:hypothetical protein
MKLISLCSLAVLAAAAGTARADKPAWCAMPGIRSGSGQLKRALVDNPRDAIPEIVEMLCTPEGNRHLDQVEAARQQWNQKLGLTEDDWADVAAWVAAGTGSGNSVIAPRGVAWSTMGAIDQYATITAAENDQEHGDVHYLADALGDHLTEAGRVAYVAVCLKSDKPTAWAVCAPDITALDPAKLAAELRADKSHSGVDRMRVRAAAYDLQLALAAHGDKVKALFAKDATWSKVFEVAAQTRSAWTAHAPGGELLATLAAMDDARVTDSTKAYAGCDDRTWAAFAAAVGAIPAAKFADLKPDATGFMYGAAPIVVGDRDGYLAATAFYACVARDKHRAAFFRLLGDAAVRWPGFRGPRSAGLSAIQTANLQLDARSERIDLPRVDREWFHNDETVSGGGRGKVSGVKRDGDTAVVSFEKKLRKEEVCTDWKDTDHIVGITASGTLQYDYICLKRGTITVNDAPAPMTVAARFLDGVKPGVTIAVLEDTVVAVWPAGAKAPSHVFGVAVK